MYGIWIIKILKWWRENILNLKICRFILKLDFKVNYKIKEIKVDLKKFEKIFYIKC